MQIYTNPGLNVSAREIDRYHVKLTPQRIMVDGVENDTRVPISFATIDAWMKTAKQTPYMVGTTAAELSAAFRETLKTDPDMIVVTASRKLIATHQAVLSAARTVIAMAGGAKIQIEPVDCGSTDLAGAMMVVYVGEAQKAGLSFDRTLQGARAFASASGGVFVPGTLDYLLRGGRATFLRALVANLLDVSPVVAFTDGELNPDGRTKRTETIAAIVEHTVKKIGRRTAIWAGVAHGGNETDAQRLARALKETFDVERIVVRPMCPTTYLHVGPKGLAFYYTRIGALPWCPQRVEP